jgi:hypothetical protein
MNSAGSANPAFRSRPCRALSDGTPGLKFHIHHDIAQFLMDRIELTP